MSPTSADLGRIRIREVSRKTGRKGGSESEISRKTGRIRIRDKQEDREMWRIRIREIYMHEDREDQNQRYAGRQGNWEDWEEGRQQKTERSGSRGYCSRSRIVEGSRKQGAERKKGVWLTSKPGSYYDPGLDMEVSHKYDS